MPQTQYSTLTLAEEAQPVKSRKGLYVLVGFAVVALAGVATLAATGHQETESAIDARFNYKRGTVMNCDSGSPRFEADLPKYDPTYMKGSFVNACYYSFRCCTSKNSGACGEGNDDNLGPECKNCLEANAPRMINEECRLYFEKKVKSGNREIDCKKKPTPDSRCAMFVGEPKYTKRMMMVGIVPKPRNPVLKMKFKNIKNCWKQGGKTKATDNATGKQKNYKKQCFELFSWCNQMCPRDDDESVDHKYCKNCFATAVYPAEVKSDSLTRNQKVPFLKFKK